MDIEYQVFIQYFSQIVWPLARISGMLLSLPVLSSIMLPRRIRVVLALALAFICAPWISEKWSFIHFQASFIGVLFEEILLGLLMGFIMQIVFQVFILGGQIIALQTGLGFATMVDPASKASVPLVGQFYLIMVSLMFLALNGHLAALETLINSFQQLPLGEASFSRSWISDILIFSGWMFKEAVQVALPAVISLLMVSLSFGIMTKVAPQLNIFSLGFPLTLLAGIILLRITLSGVSDQMADSLRIGIQLLNSMVR